LQTLLLLHLLSLFLIIILGSGGSTKRPDINAAKTPSVQYIIVPRRYISSWFRMAAIVKITKTIATIRKVQMAIVLLNGRIIVRYY
jgi:hypothetical protein